MSPDDDGRLIIKIEHNIRGIQWFLWQVPIQSEVLQPTCSEISIQNNPVFLKVIDIIRYASLASQKYPGLLS